MQAQTAATKIHALLQQPCRVTPVRIGLAILVLLCSGCSAYLTPGGPASLSEISKADGELVLAQQPSPRFPVRLEMVRLQAPAYKSFSASGLGGGRFSVLGSHELLGESSLRSIAQWPLVAEAEPLDASLLPDRLQSLDDLRLAAAKHQTDVLMIYTLDTGFQIKGERYAAAADLALGTAPDPQASVSSTASAMFIDVRTGYSYGAVQSVASLSDLASSWRDARSLDGKRLQVERQAFEGLLGEAQRSWSGIAKRYQYAQSSPAQPEDALAAR